MLFTISLNLHGFSHHISTVTLKLSILKLGSPLRLLVALSWGMGRKNTASDEAGKPSALAECREVMK